MNKIESFEDLEAWQTARELTRQIYDITKRGDFSRDFALRDQVREAAISVSSNIAEGFESRTTRLFVDYLGRAKASAGEVRAQLYLALDQGYMADEQFEGLLALTGSLARQLRRFSQYLDGAAERFQVREETPPYGDSSNGSLR